MGRFKTSQEREKKLMSRKGQHHSKETQEYVEKKGFRPKIVDKNVSQQRVRQKV